MRLQGVSFRYHRRGPWVLRDVTLHLAPGQVIEVTGRNGAGKSTFLRLVAGLRTPRRGTITGRPGRVGYAPERFPADQPFTVRGYLSHMAAIQKAPRTAIDTWAERLALTHLLDTRLPELSKGSAQKVGLAQALLTSPELLVLDEPFAGLDTTTREALPDLVSELAAQGTTVIASDHQRCLSSLPDLTRIHIADQTATLLSSPDTPTRTTAPTTASCTTTKRPDAPTHPDGTERPRPTEHTIAHPHPAPAKAPTPASPTRAESAGAPTQATPVQGPNTPAQTTPVEGSHTPTRPDATASPNPAEAPLHSATAPAPRPNATTPPTSARHFDTPRDEPSHSEAGSAEQQAGTGTPSSPTAEPGGADAIQDGAWKVVEVVVRADELDEVVSRLRAEGLEVREPKR